MGKSGNRDESKKIIEGYKPNSDSEFEISMSSSLANNAENDFTVYVTYTDDMDSYFYIIEWDKGNKTTIEECMQYFKEYITALLSVSSLPSIKEINELIVGISKECTLELPNDIRGTKTINKKQISSDIIKYSMKTIIIERSEDNVFYYLKIQDGRVVEEIIDKTDIRLQRAEYTRVNRNIMVNKYPTGDNKINLQIHFNSETNLEELNVVLTGTPKTIEAINNKADFIDTKGVVYTLTIWYEDSSNNELANTPISQILSAADEALNIFVGKTKDKGLL